MPDYVFRVNETSHERSGTQELNDQHKYTRSFRIEGYHFDMDASVIWDNPLIPDLLDTYETQVLGSDDSDNLITDPDSVCTSRRLRPQGEFTSNVWELVCEYERNLLAEPAQLSVSTSTYNKPLTHAFNGTVLGGSGSASGAGALPSNPFNGGVAMVNRAGDPYSPAIEREESDLVITITDYVSTYSFSDTLTYQNTVNLDNFLNLGIGTCRCIMYGVDRVEYGDIFIYQRRIQVQFRRDGWEARVLEQGYNVIDPNDPTKRIKPKDRRLAEALSGQVLLDTDGTELPPGADPCYTSYEIYPVSTWSNFGVTL